MLVGKHDRRLERANGGGKKLGAETTDVPRRDFQAPGRVTVTSDLANSWKAKHIDTRPNPQPLGLLGARGDKNGGRRVGFGHGRRDGEIPAHVTEAYAVVRVEEEAPVGAARPGPADRHHSISSTFAGRSRF
jgi:hypothetical protein